MTMNESENQNATFSDSRMNVDSVAFSTKISDENGKDVDDIPMDSETGTIYSPRKYDRDGLSDHVIEMNPDQKQISPEHQNLVTPEGFTKCHGNESGYSSSDFYTDKNVLECEFSEPELEVPKDIRVDDNHCGEAKEALSADDHTAGENDGKLIDQERLKSNRDTAKHCEANKCASTNYSEEYLTQTTFLRSLDVEGNRLSSDQIPNRKAVADGPATSSAESDSLLYNNKTESFSSKIINDKNLRDANLYAFSSDDQARSPRDKSQCSTDDDMTDVGTNYAKRNSGNDIAVSQWKYEHGQTSFSAVTYSGPIALTESLSIRSDASTTSARSFAFPILQSEWTNSPVRMAKADRRHFRKQKGWRSGVLCCRF